MKIENTMQLSRKNNFDLIRVLAALQVVYVHASKHLFASTPKSDTYLYYINEIIEKFPGVPIFFTVSGFLVYWSLERNQNNLTKFFKNRLLRIYPGLWACLLITIVLLLIFGAVEVEDFGNKQLYIWLFSQLTFFQFYTPDIIRDFGVGTPNGSLWTITVELQYYLILPIIFFLLTKLKKKLYKNICLFIIILSSLIFAYFIKNNYHVDTIINKLAAVTVLTYLYNFLFGILIFINWNSIKKYIENKVIYWLSFYLIYIILFYFIGNMYGKGYVPNLYGVTGFLLLSILTISLAYSKPILIFLTKGNDISYGVYIYHMLVINTLIELNINTKISFIFSFICSILLGILSWRLIEKKALKFKSR